jgi:rod shape determining protein RodA
MLKNFDFSLLINVIFICMIGVITISSATRAFYGGSKRYFILQIVWILIGLGLLAVTVMIDYATFRMYYKVIYFFNLALLGLVVALGQVTKGANSWLGLGSLGIQPSEFMKLSLIIVFARKIEDFEGDVNNLKNLGILFLYAAVPLFMIYKQPDLGTVVIIIVIIVGMLFMAGLNLKVIFWGLAAGIAAFLGLWYSPLPILKEHQRQRISTFFNQSADTIGNGWQITQSKIAIGSGQLFGMGFGKGLQSEGKYLPESYSDFIFSVLGEEFGFVGALILIILYASMLFKCIKISHIAKDKFGSMVVIGIMWMFLFQMFQNIGMTVGLMPITGITLPFVSYGGSSMLTSMISIGLVLNIGMRRHKINF